MKLKPCLLSLLAWLVLQAPCYACTPFVQLLMLFTPASFWGAYALRPGTLVPSVVGLEMVAGLAAVVAVKCAIFFGKSNFRSPMAIVGMVLGNLITTAIGCVLVATVIPPIGMFFIPLLLPFFLRTARVLIGQRARPIGTAGQVTLLLFLAYIASLVAFGFAIYVMHISVALYWLLKFTYAIIGGGIGFLVSFAYEEAVMAWVYRKYTGKEQRFIDPVFWANAAGFAIAVGTAALLTLPERLHSPFFLIGR